MGGYWKSWFRRHNGVCWAGRWIEGKNGQWTFDKNVYNQSQVTNGGTYRFEYGEGYDKSKNKYFNFGWEGESSKYEILKPAKFAIQYNATMHKLASNPPTANSPLVPKTALAKYPNCTSSNPGSDLNQGLSSGAFLLGTTTSLYEGYLTKENELLSSALKGGGYAYRRPMESAIDFNKAMISGTKYASKALFATGVVMSVVDIHNNDYSASSIIIASIDTYMGYLAFIPGFQLASGIYFTARIGYQMYEDANK